jgi:adenosylcobinamide-GDP ribazoletransferase
MRDAFALLTTFGRRGGALKASALRWFPIVGAALGACLGLVWWATDHVWPRAVAGAMVVAADLACTGLLHVDGLADSADGLLPHATRERRLEIMRTPDVGAFGIATVAITLLLAAASLASRAASILLLTALWCAARSVVASVPAIVPYARAQGIATPLLEGAPVWPAAVAIPAVVVGALGAGPSGAVAIAACVVAVVAVVAFAWRRVGGFTGDVLGAAIVVGETVGLIVAAAKW